MSRYYTTNISGEIKEEDFDLKIEFTQENANKFKKTDNISFADATAKQLEKYKVSTILDIGCGKYSPPVMLVNSVLAVTGIDLNAERLEEAGEYYKEVKQLDAREALRYFGEKSFDAVIAFDFLEHLKKSESIKLVSDCEKMARKLIVFFIPLEVVEVKENQIDEALMAHKCSWTREEFEAMGYVIEYYNGPFNHILAIKGMDETL